MRSPWGGSVFFLWMVMIGQLSAQCGCMEDGCGSVCDCGCNDPGGSGEPGGPGEGNYESLNIELLSRLSLSEMGVINADVRGNDCWGWRYEKNGREFAIFGLTNGTAFVEITDPTRPRYLGTLPSAGGNTTWRDMKVYKNRCYIVADGGGNANHGVQVFDLHRLLNRTREPVVYTADARLTSIGRAHNIAINEASGMAYVVGSPSLNSAGGPIILDLNQGLMPVVVAVYKDDGYCHDLQVVEYQGLKKGAKRKEIAFCCNEDSLTILDVTNKNNILLISRTTYFNSAYSHQGWLSQDQRFFFMNDELDEQQISTTRTRTHVWSVSNISAPQYVGFVEGTNRTIDHNLYVKGNFIFQANYASGLRVLSVPQVAKLNFEEVGFFDTYPTDNAVNFNGAWSVYPYFASGNIIVSDRQNGLFVLKFTPP